MCISMIIEILRCHDEICMEIIVVDRLRLSPHAGRRGRRRKRRDVEPLCHDLKRQ